MNTAYLTSKTLELMSEGIPVKQKIDFLMVYLRCLVTPAAGKINAIDGDKTLSDFVNSMTVEGDFGNIALLNANDLLAVTQALLGFRPIDTVNVDGVGANNLCYMETLVPIFCGQYVDTIQPDIADFTADGDIITPDAGTNVFSLNKIDVYHAFGDSGLDPYSFSVNNAVVSATGDGTYIKDQLNKPVKGIIVRCLNSSKVPADILDKLTVLKNANEVVYNVKSDNYLRRQQELFGRIPNYTADTSYNAGGTTITELTRRNRPAGEFHIKFSKPIIADNLTFNYKATATGSMRVIFMY